VEDIRALEVLNLQGTMNKMYFSRLTRVSTPFAISVASEEEYRFAAKLLQFVNNRLSIKR
jgi:hypothetical protein